MGRTFNVAQRKPVYQHITMKANLYTVANQAAKTTTAALATTFTGLSITNPATNTKSLVIIEFGWAQFAVGAAGAIGLMGGAVASTHNAAAELTPKNMQLNSANTSVALVDTDCTIATPVLWRVCGSMGSVATTGYGAQPPNIYKVDGSIIIPPGYFIATYTTTVQTSALLFHFVWEEV